MAIAKAQRSQRIAENGMGKKILKFGAISREDYKKRTIAIARGEYKPKKNEPKVWFESVQLMHRFSAARIKNCLKS